MLYDFWSNKGDSDRSEVLRKALVEDWTQLDRSNFQTSADIRRIFLKIFLCALPTYLGTIHILRHHIFGIFGSPSPSTSACF